MPSPKLLVALGAIALGSACATARPSAYVTSPEGAAAPAISTEPRVVSGSEIEIGTTLVVQLDQAIGTDVSKPFDQDVWELYNVAEDFSEVDDLADAEPAKLKELQELWWEEAERYQVLPLNNMPAFGSDRAYAYDAPATSARITTPSASDSFGRNSTKSSRRRRHDSAGASGGSTGFGIRREGRAERRR